VQDNLAIKVEVEKLKKMYEEDPRSKSYSAIIYGATGSGKTSLLRTCRLPLHIDSFDPGGTKVLQGEAILNGQRYPDEFSKGNIIIDSRFENEDPMNPAMAKLWDDEFHRRKDMGYFDKIGTYVIDSMTTWAQCIMYDVLKKAGRSGGTPQKNDWLPQMTVIEKCMRSFISMPCDCILLGHEDMEKDEASGRVLVTLLITGKLSTRIPALFDEIHHADTKETSSGIQYQLLTRKTGIYVACSRLSNKGQLDMYEVPDIKNILKKAGYDYQDKPNLLEV
jgi:hypothetical protein